MRYLELGSTGLHLSLIGFGASPLGNVFGDVDSAASTRAVAAALDQGINFFDVSPYYGLTLAEERLGEALASRRNEVFVATKCGRYGVDTFDFSAKSITREFNNSLRRLRTNHVDILQAHDIEFGDVHQILGETLPAMHRLKEQGKARFIGLTSYWPGLLARVASQADVDCVLNYCHANLFVDDMDRELVPMAKQRGIGLLNASPLHMGLLAPKPVPVWHPAPQAVRDAAQELLSICEQYGVNPGALGLYVCLHRHPVASTLVGLSSEAEVITACAALDWTPPEHLLRDVRRIVEPVHNVVWPSGLKQNQDTPVNTRGTCDVSR